MSWKEFELYMKATVDDNCYKESNINLLILPDTTPIITIKLLSFCEFVSVHWVAELLLKVKQT